MSKICPDCTKITQEKCDPLCEIEVNSDCVIHDEALACLDLPAGSTLADILNALCGITGTNIAIETEDFHDDANDDCPNGFTQVNLGLDNTGNGEIDVVLVTFNICDGADGVSPTLTITEEPAGANCIAGGVKIVSSGSTFYVCNGVNGTDGQDGQDAEDAFATLDFSCLADAGVEIGETVQDHLQALINVVCTILADNPVALPVASNLTYEVCVGSTLEINLLTGAILPSAPVVSVDFVNASSGKVNYDPTVPPASGIISIEGAVAGIEVRQFTIEDGSGTSVPANLTINVVECPEPSIADLFSGPNVEMAICGCNSEFRWAIPFKTTGLVFGPDFKMKINFSGKGGTELSYTTVVKQFNVSPTGVISDGDGVGGTITPLSRITNGGYQPVDVPTCDGTLMFGGAIIQFWGTVTVDGEDLVIPSGTPITFTFPSQNYTPTPTPCEELSIINPYLV